MPAGSPALPTEDRVVCYSNGRDILAKRYYLADAALGVLICEHSEALAYVRDQGFSNREAKAYLNSLPLEIRMLSADELRRYNARRASDC